MKLACRNCGFDLVNENEAIQAVQAEYNYSAKELRTTHIVKVWCPDCAVADGRVDDLSETRSDFHWEVRKA